MSPSWERLSDLFEAALARDGAARAEFLAELPATERHRLEVLLAADATDFPALDAPPAVLESRTVDSLLSGTRAGPWEIVGELGRGGMGRVYLARRADGLYEQRVALKCLERRAGDTDLGARFAAERRILASLEHPGIARLLDAGHLADTSAGGDSLARDTAAGGTAYLVLEHVAGRPIDQWADEQRLGLAARLELVERVARVLGFAHRRLVIHCDLKPSNVMVSSDGEVKLLDFGIARLLGESGGGSRRLTPAFASPEQARGETLGTASDIYSLGALLYLLVTGQPPLELANLSATALAERLSRDAPPAPSKLVTLPRLWRHDLDALLNRALAKEAADRYESAEAFADDLRRLRLGFPLAARPRSWSYRAGRFLLRHRLASLASTLGLLVALGGVWRIHNERQIANRERGRAQRVARFMASLFRGANPAEDEAGLLFSGNAAARAARELLLDEGVTRLRAELAAEPLVAAEPLLEIGNAYRQLGGAAKAVPLLHEVLEIRRRLLPAGDPALAEPLLALCRAHSALGALDEAEAFCHEVLEIRRARLGEAHPDTAEVVNELGLLARARGDLNTAHELFETSLKHRRAALPADHGAVLASLNNLALVLEETEHADQAEPLFTEVLAARRARLAPDHLLIAHAENNLASVKERRERFEEAEALYRAALERVERGLGGEHPFAATLRNNLGALWLRRGEPERAREACEQALAIAQRAWGELHADVARVHQNLGVARHLMGDNTAARGHFTRALRIRRQVLEVSHPEVADTVFSLTAIEQSAGEWAAAERVLRDALADWATTPPRQTWAEPYARAFLGRLRALQGHPEEARALLEAARLGLEQRGFGAGTPLGDTVATWLAELLQPPPGTPKPTERTATP